MGFNANRMQAYRKLKLRRSITHKVPVHVDVSAARLRGHHDLGTIGGRVEFICVLGLGSGRSRFALIFLLPS